MIRLIFQEQGLPQDLVYLAMIESRFNPLARSPKEAGALAIQRRDARRYGLPEKSTKAAVRYLKDLHDNMKIDNANSIIIINNYLFIYLF